MSDAPVSERERWNARYREAAAGPAEPSRLLAAVERFLPTHGRALDVAGGAGRNALWLARRGLDVTLLDVSDVALEIATERAREAELGLATVRVDLEHEPPPPGPWDVVLSILYLNRPLLGALPLVMSAGGVLVVAQPTRINLERHARPPERFLLAPGELITLATLAGELDVLHYEEGWLADGRHDALLVARRRAEASADKGAMLLP